MRSLHFDHASSTASALDALLKDAPEFTAGLALCAKLQIEEQEFFAARSTLRDVLIINPRSYKALSLLAGLYYLAGEDETAQHIVNDVRARSPGYAEIYQTLAELSESNRRYADAVEFAVIAHNVDRQAWASHATAGINRTRIGQHEIGRRSLKVAFAGDPFNVRIKNTLDLLDQTDADFKLRKSEHFELLAHKTKIDALAPLALPLAEQAFKLIRSAMAISLAHRFG